METRYVQRDPVTGEITGHFSHKHDYAQEELPEDHPELQAYRAQREQRAATAVSPIEALKQRVDALEAEVAALKALP